MANMRSGLRSTPRNKSIKSLATPARICAFETLKLAQDASLYISNAFDKISVSMASQHLKQEEKAFARLLSVGVVSTVGVLDNLIDWVLSSPSDIKQNVRIALRISTYELFFLKKSYHAAVDQGVELVRYVSPKASGLANFVLRRLSDLQKTFPFGNAQEDFEVAIYEQGFPLWLGKRLKKELGEQHALTIMKTANMPAPLFAMINACRVDAEKTLEILYKQGIELFPVASLCGKPDFPSFVFNQRAQASDAVVRRLIGEAVLVISDISAQTIASLSLPAQKPNRFLEIGSGRGTKTLMLQTAARARYGEQMPIDTVEISSKKNRESLERIEKGHVVVNKQYCLDATDLSSLPNSAYDAVFIDAPCSGVGTLRRHPEIRWRLKPKDIPSLANIGFNMLCEASKKVAMGGRITYATCTCFAEENDAVIEKFLNSPEGANFSVLSFAKNGQNYFRSPILENGSDIHFAAILKRVRAR